MCWWEMKREKKNAQNWIKYINFSHLLSVFNPRLRKRQQFISGHYCRLYEVTLFHHSLLLFILLKYTM